MSHKLLSSMSIAVSLHTERACEELEGHRSIVGVLSSFYLLKDQLTSWAKEHFK